MLPDDYDDSEYLFKGPCSKCGSSDANAHYSDGHTYCFSCRGVEKGEGGMEETAKKKDSSLPEIEGFDAWTSRGLNAKTCKKWGIGVVPWKGKKARVFERRDQEGNVVGLKVRPAQKNDIRTLGETKRLQLFGQHLWRSKGKRVVITEGEVDAPTISQLQDHKWPVVSVINGASGAAQDIRNNIDWLMGFEEVVLAFDNDEPGRKAVAECAPLFKPGQCKVAYFDLKDANDMHKAGRGKEVIDGLWGAKTYRPDGIVMGSELYGEITKEEVVASQSYPWRGLQEKTLGCRLGEVVTVTAGSGIGKSAVIREIAYSLAVEQSEPIGMLMFEETVRRTALGLLSIEMEKPLTLMPHPQKEEGFDEAFKRVLGSDRVFLYDHFGSTEIDNVLDRIRYMATALGVRWVVLDHLSILISGMGEGDERRLIDNAMTALKSLAMELNIGLFLVSHLKRPEGKGHENGAATALGQLRGSHAIAQLSDIVIGLERDQQNSKNRDVTTVRLLKNRFTGETGVAGWLRYDRHTGRLKELLDDPFTEGGSNPFDESGDTDLY